MRVIVCGDRMGYTPSVVRRVLTALAEDHGTDLTILHGGARGVDAMAGDMARGLGITVEEYPADWRGKGRVAGLIRNQEMLESGAERVIAFKAKFDHTLRKGGTEHMVRIAMDAGVPCVVIDEETQ